MNMAEYASLIVTQVVFRAPSGLWKKFPQATSVSGSENAMIKAPITRAVKTARIGSNTASENPFRTNNRCKKLLAWISSGLVLDELSDVELKVNLLCS
jgi:hypothetical protein